ncbi:UNVERIFIED_CONTAM: RpI1 [Trichonephila clavipes]
MTLNTFHFAGKGEMNVTLGIPRIREILMTASPNIATPTMDLPFLDLPGIKEKAEKLKQKISPICMKDILDEVHVKEYLSVSVTRSRNYVIKMIFLKHSEYKNHANTTPTKILYYVEQVFIRRLITALSKRMGLSSSRLFIMKEKSESSKNELDEEKDTTPMIENVKDENESSEESEGEGDTTDANLKKQQEEEYQEPEEEEMLPDSENENEEEEECVEKETNSGNEDKSPSVKEEIMSDNEDTNLKTIFTLPEMPKKVKKNVVTDYDKLQRINVGRLVTTSGD